MRPTNNASGSRRGRLQVALEARRGRRSTVVGAALGPPLLCLLLVSGLVACGAEDPSALASSAVAGGFHNPPLTTVQQPARRVQARMEAVWVLGKSAEGTFEPAAGSGHHAGHRPSMDGPEGVGPLLGRPIAVRAGGDGRVYIADKASLQVKVYDRQGEVLGAFGGRGREPGQFLTLSAMHVAAGNGAEQAADRLVVADGISSRLTAFGPQGEVETLAETNVRDMLWPRYLQHLGSGEMVFLYKMPTHMRDGTERPDAGFLFHLYAEDLSTKLGAFGAVEDFGPAEAPIVDAFSQVRPGHFWVTQDDAVLYAPSLYEGRLYRYRRNPAGEWGRDQVFEGFIAQGPPLLEVSPEEEQQHLHFKITRGGVAMAARIRNESRGIFELADGRIVHFSLQTVARQQTSTRQQTAREAAGGEDAHAHHGGQRDQVIFGAELFSPQGEFLGYGPVETFTEHGHTEQFYVDWKDDQDRFYIREMTDRFVVWIVDLEIASFSAVEPEA